MFGNMKRLLPVAAVALMLAAATASSARAPAGPPKLKIQSATAIEGQASRMVFRITLSKHAPRAVTGRYYTQDASAKAGSDYVAASGRFKIPKGGSRTRIVVKIVDDEVPEPDEHFFLIVNGVKNASVAHSFAQANIVDDDVAP